MEEELPTLTPRIAGYFNSFQQWVNHASSWLTGEVDSNGYPISCMCVDAKGRRCHNGKDFMRARDEDAFPVYYFWDCEPIAEGSDQ